MSINSVVQALLQRERGAPAAPLPHQTDAQRRVAEALLSQGMGQTPQNWGARRRGDGQRLDGRHDAELCQPP